MDEAAEVVEVHAADLEEAMAVLLWVAMAVLHHSEEAAGAGMSDYYCAYWIRH